MSNILILNLSAFLGKNIPEAKVYASDMGEITGIYTNDAPVK